MMNGPEDFLTKTKKNMTNTLLFTKSEITLSWNLKLVLVETCFVQNNTNNTLNKQPTISEVDQFSQLGRMRTPPHLRQPNFFFPCLFFNKIKEKRKIIFFYTNSETIFSCFYVILMYMLNRKYTCAYYFLGFDMPRREAKPSPESSYYSRITRLPSRTWRGHARPQRKWRGEISWIRTSPRHLHNYLMR